MTLMWLRNKRHAARRAVARALVAALVPAAVACGGDTERPAPVRSMYYWNTAFGIDSAKAAFMEEHGVSRLYVRYFDVVMPEGADFPVPNATIRIDSVPQERKWDVVPVVFVMPDALQADVRTLARKILDRAVQMSETHGMGPTRELQIDCDWTRRTEARFLAFMDEMHRLTGARGMTLSVTIRLHQLRGKVPAADRGVLMVYNTGDLRRLDKEKPILDIDDVRPYLRYLEDYPLRLASAYPIYRWDLRFRNGRFVDIVHERNGLPLAAGDTVVTRVPAADDILRTRRAVETALPQCAEEIILFDLNNYNIKRYDSKTFEDFYR